jgi:cell division transport system permease protein
MHTLKESWTNLKRHNLLSIATIISLGLILIVFNVLISYHLEAKNFIDELSSKINYTIYLKSDTSQEEINQIQQYLSTQPEITSLTFQSNSEALQNIEQKYPSSAKFLETYELKNPLPNSFKVTTNELEDHQTIQNRIENSAFQENLLQSKIRQEHTSTLQTIVNNLIKIKNTSLNAFLGILGIFILAGSLITFNAIKTSLYNRKNEIQIMQFVGATLSRIRSPFLLESVLIGVLSFLLNLILLIPISQIFMTSFVTNHNLLILFSQLAASLILSFFTSLFLVNQHLKSKQIYQD